MPSQALLIRTLLVLSLLAPAVIHAETGPVTTPAEVPEAVIPAPADTTGPVAASAPAAQLSPPGWRDRLSTGVGGYIRPYYSVVRNTGFNTNDQNGFGFSAVRLEFDARYRVIQGQAFGRATGDLRSGSMSLRDAYVGWEPWSELRLAVGQFKVPYGFASLRSSRTSPFTGSALAGQITYGRDLGAMLSGKAELARLVDDRPFLLSWYGGAFNGDGANQFQNANDRLLYAGRLLLEPLGAIGSSESDLSPCNGFGKDADCDPNAARPLRVALGTSAAYDRLSARGKNFDLNRPELRWAVEAHAKWKGLFFQAEYLRGELEATALDGAFSREAWLVQAGYNPGYFDWLEVVGRYEYFDYDTVRDNAAANPQEVEFQARTRTTLGLNAYLAGHRAKLMLHYIMVDLQEGVTTSPEGDPLFGDTLILQAQVGF